MSLSREITVAIVEDNEAVGATLRKVVDTAEHLRVVGLWSSGAEALIKIEALRPQVILMDINLPDISGIDVTRRIKQYLPEVQIIMITVFFDHANIFAALRAGASGYLVKHSSPSEIRAAITDVLAGGAPMTPEIARRIVDAFHQPASGNPGGVKLSLRETQVLERLGEGLGTKEIAHRLEITIETVRAHFKNIYRKLQVRSRTEAMLKYSNFRNPDYWIHPAYLPWNS